MNEEAGPSLWELPPVLARELRRRLRVASPRTSRRWIAVAAMGISLLALLGPAMLGYHPDGSFTHQLLFFGALYLAAGPALEVGAGLLTREREQTTIELLMLTGRTPASLFADRLAAGMLIAASDVLGLIPFLSLPFLCGGISLSLFVATLVSLPSAFCLVLGIAVMCSATTEDEGRAAVLAIVVATTVCLLVPLPYFLASGITGGPPFDKHWLALSPAYGAYLVATQSLSGNGAAFWQSTALCWILGLPCLVRARFLFAAEAKPADAPPRRGSPGTQGWVASLLQPRIPPGTLETMPYQWRVERQSRVLRLAWAITLGIVILWLSALHAWGARWASPLTLFATAYLLLVVLDALRQHAAAQCVAEDRRSGLLELMLAADTPPATLLEGLTAGVARQFRPLEILVGLLLVVMGLGGWAARPWTPGGLVVYGTIWSVILACFVRQRRPTPLQRGAWIALNTGRAPASLMFSRSNRGGNWIWMMFNMRNLFQGFRGTPSSFPTGSAAEIAITLGVAFILMLVFLAQIKESSAYPELFEHHLRDILNTPVPEPDDPRLKTWRGDGVLPPPVDPAAVPH